VTEQLKQSEALSPGSGTGQPAYRQASLRVVLTSLLRADFTSQRRNARAWMISIFLPLVLMFALSAGKRAQTFSSPELRMGLSITAGLMSIAVFGYSLNVARDREMGIFQRLRVAPAPTWAIMVSRLAVQVVFMLIVAVVVLLAGGLFANATLSVGAYPLTLVVVIFGSIEFLGIGQALVGLIPSADTVNAVGRLLYIPLFLLGILGQAGIGGPILGPVFKWSPISSMTMLLAGAMEPSGWSAQTWYALVATVVYAAVFASLGIRWFRWTGR